MRRVRVRAARRRRRAPGDHATASQCSIREVYTQSRRARTRETVYCVLTARRARTKPPPSACWCTPKNPPRNPAAHIPPLPRYIHTRTR